MKIQVTYKCPDALYMAAVRAVEQQDKEQGFSSGERTTLINQYVEELYEAGLSEYITLEVNTVTKTVTHVKDP